MFSIRVLLSLIYNDLDFLFIVKLLLSFIGYVVSFFGLIGAVRLFEIDELGVAKADELS